MRRDPDFAGRLKAALRRAGLTQKEAAGRIGISEHGMSNYARGRVPEARILYQIAQLCNCSMEWLLAGKGKGPEATAPEASLDHRRQERGQTPLLTPFSANTGEGDDQRTVSAPEIDPVQAIKALARQIFESEAQAAALVRLAAQTALLERPLLERLAAEPDGPDPPIQIDAPSSNGIPLQAILTALNHLTTAELQLLHTVITQHLKTKGESPEHPLP